MKEYKEALIKVFREERELTRWVVVNFLAGFFVFIFSLVKLRPDSAVVKIGYGDIGGYRDGSWTDMLVFPVMAALVGTVHSLLAIRIYQAKGAGLARIFMAVSFGLIVGAFVALLRLLGEG